MTNQEKSESEALFNLTEIGSEIAGGLAPIAVGAVLAGPAGAVAGVVVAPFAGRTFGKLAKEFNERVLGRREKARVGATVLYVITKIQEKLDAGEQPRQDGFFEASPGDRAAADEIAEGVLLAAQREHEERKLKYYGNLLANITFRTDIDRNLANQLIVQAKNISYQQLCLLSLCVRKSELGLSALPTFADNSSILDLSIQALVQDLYLQLILSGMQGSDGYFHVFALGKLLFELMGLRDIDQKSLQELHSTLVGKSSPSH